jgi:hypothetical protein
VDIVIETPHFPDDIEACLALIDKQDCWDGFAVSGRTINDLENWDDALNASETFWRFLDGLLPDAVSSQLPDLETAPREKIIEHTIALLQRTTSLDLTCASLDLGVDRLSWPNADTRYESVDAELKRREEILKALLPEAQSLGCRLCLSLRHPCPPITRQLTDLTLQLLSDIGRPECRLMLNVVIDELPSMSADEVLAEFIEQAAVIRLHYEPILGVRMYGEEQQNWADYLSGHKFDGQVIFAPSVDNVATFGAELERLAPQIWEFWR